MLTKEEKAILDTFRIAETKNRREVRPNIYQFLRMERLCRQRNKSHQASHKPKTTRINSLSFGTNTIPTRTNTIPTRTDAIPTRTDAIHVGTEPVRPRMVNIPKRTKRIPSRIVNMHIRAAIFATEWLMFTKNNQISCLFLIHSI